MAVREEVFYVRVCLTGPPDQIARAVRYAKENVARGTEDLHRSLGVSSSVGIYTKGVLFGQDHRVLHEKSTLVGDGDMPPGEMTVTESDD